MKTVTVRRYRRHWAVYLGRKLLCVTLYRKGAHAVQAVMEAAFEQAA